MDVLMVTNNALEDKIGGHERYVRELSSTLVGLGHEVTIIAKRWSADQPARDERPDGVLIERFAVPDKSNPLFAVLFPAYVLWGISARVRLRQRSAVHVHMGLQALPLVLNKVPYALTFHAPVWRELLSERQDSYVLPSSVQQAAVGGLRKVESSVARHATIPVVLSEFMRSELGLLDADAAERAHRIPGGVDSSRFFEGRGVLRVDDPPTLFTARRLTPRTGVDELIRCMPRILEEFPGAKLKIAGTGRQERELKDLAKNLGLGVVVEFLGRISDDELVERYRRATLVVMPTRELEGFGLSTAEALACGAAVVGTSAGATPELLTVLDPGLVADDVSAAAIARAILTLLKDPGRLARIRAAAPSVVLPAMSWSAVADRYLELYEELTAR